MLSCSIERRAPRERTLRTSISPVSDTRGLSSLTCRSWAPTLPCSTLTPRDRKSDVAKTTRVVVRAETSEEPQTGDWRMAVHELAAMERPSASDGERRAGELIAERLRAAGAQGKIEKEGAHGRDRG